MPPETKESAQEKTTAMRLLIVEDDTRLLRTLNRALKEEGYAVDCAEDGEEGLRKATELDYDLILLDIMLPRRDGLSLLAELRKVKKTPVIFLTARDTADDRIKGLDQGGDDYIVKPFDLSELFARVRAVIRRSRNEPSPNIVLGDVTVDTLAKTVIVNGKPVILTAREYAILEYLAIHHKRIVTRSELYEHLFDDYEDTLSNLLDVHVYNIRKKLKIPLITTRRGYGYTIDR